jgi:hypothetical protein
VASVPDAEWDEQEQAWMLALKQYRDSRCPHCGGDLAVTTDPKNEDSFRHELPLQCFRCVGFARGREAYRDEPHADTLLHLVQQRPTRGRG